MAETNYPLVTRPTVVDCPECGEVEDWIAGRDGSLDVRMGRRGGRLSKRANRHFLVGRGPVVTGDG